jgi:hypothetical protein
MKKGDLDLYRSVLRLASSGSAAARAPPVDVDGLTAADTAVIGEPTEMMLCNADGSDKHNRWFWVDAETRTLNWAKKKNGKKKKQKQLTGCAADASNKLTFAGTDDESKATETCAIAASPSVARAWHGACVALLDNLDAYKVVGAPSDPRASQ